MSNLLSMGFSATQVVKLNTDVMILNNTDKNNARAIQGAQSVFDGILYLIQKVTRKPTEEALALMGTELGISSLMCSLTGSYFASQFMVAIPDGRGRYVRRDYLLSGTWDWSFDEAGVVMRNTRLYGDRDILGYTTDPLQYLKFRCLPNEKLEYFNNDDECVMSEYSGVAPVFLGIELEVERKPSTPKKIAHMVTGDLGMDYVILKSDSSVPEGFEIVTAPATIGFHLKQWDKFFDNSAKHLTSWASGKCGMHVHINRAAFTPMHLGKFTAFINNNENRDFVTTIAGRSSTYSKFVEDTIFHVKTKLISHIVKLTNDLNRTTDKEKRIALEKELAIVKAKANRSVDCNSLLYDMEYHGLKEQNRHVAVNLCKKGTIEVRIFRGNVAKVGMLKNLEFVAAAVEFTREATFKTSELTKEEQAERVLKRKEHTDYSLHFTYFLDWLEKDTTGNYNNLKTWLQTSKITDKFTKKKVSSKAPANKQVTDDDIRMTA